jgi:hypothetical protein
MSYYRSKVEDISAPEVRQLFDDLCRIRGWLPGEHYELVVYKWLILFFMDQTAAQVTAKQLAYESPLTTRISRMANSEVYVFCRELCLERGEGIEMHETGKVLTLIKKLYAAPKSRLGKVRKPIGI